MGVSPPTPTHESAVSLTNTTLTGLCGVYLVTGSFAVTALGCAVSGVIAVAVLLRAGRRS
jgi:hypothetical protein